MILLDGYQIKEHEAAGKTIGYSVHARETKKALQSLGVQFVTDQTAAEAVFHQLPSVSVKRVLGLRNYLYTAFEAPDLPEEYIYPANQMDGIICVSEFVSRAYRKAINKKIPVETCHLGVDVDWYKYEKRKKGNPFIFLWVGSTDNRKGWQLLMKAWAHVGKNPNCVLLAKTTGLDGGELKTVGNLVIDSRKYTDSDMVHLYHYAHCFVFPSLSEGFGLPLVEAMSTGLPCIFNPWGGVTEFANRKNAYPLKNKLQKINYGVTTTAAIPMVSDIVRQMKYVMNNYEHALDKGKKASRTIRKNFTWQHTGRRMKEILSSFIGGKHEYTTN